MSYTWDAAGNRMSLEYPDEKAVAYSYDLLGRMSSVTDWNDGQITYTYDIAGSLLATARPNGVTSTYLYDDLGRVLTITHATSSETLSSFVYSYDEAGNRTQAVENVSMLDLIFADGFESGNFSAWSAHTHSDDLVVTESAALTGSYGMQAVIDDNEYLLVHDLTPAAETHYHARFYFDPNGLSMASGDGIQVLLGEMATQPSVTVVWKVHFRKWQGSYRLDAYVRRDDGTWGTPVTTQVTDDVHAVEVEWRASSGAGQDDGLLRLWVDGTQIGQILSVDNDTYVVDGVRLGVVSPPASTTSGTLCFDAFESRRASYIGLLEGVQACGGGQRGQEMMEEVVSDTLEITGTLAVEEMIVELTATLPVTWENWLAGSETTELTDTVELTVTEVLSPTLPTAEAVDAGMALAALIESLPSAPQALEEQEDSSLTIVYEYDHLNRLTSATYSDGRYFEYTYDAVGNRLSEATDSGTVEYDYDAANRLEYVDGQPYTWDDNGNLLDDGVNTYTYDQANRLASVSSTEYEVEYGYNGLGDRLWQTVDSETTTYTLDLIGGLTQVLADDTYTYLYGVGRIAQFTGENGEYFLGDALGSVRQLVDENGDLTLARGYEPFGEELEVGGEASSSYGFTGEWTDATGLLYLRARYYAPQDGRFISRDTWREDQQQPMSYNAWLYVYANPVNLTDPGGMCPDMNRDGKCDKTWECDLMPSPYREWCWGELGCAGNGDGGWGGYSTSGCPTVPPFTFTKDPNKYSEDYGRLFIDLLNRCPGWWKNYMGYDTDSTTSRNTKKTAIAYAYKWEAYSLTDKRWRDGLGKAFAHRYWSNAHPAWYGTEEKGFLYLIGSRQAVRARVCNHYFPGVIFPKCPIGTSHLPIQSDWEMNQDSDWNEGYYTVAGSIWTTYYDQPGEDYRKEPFEFGSISMHPNELQNASEGTCPNELYYVSDPNIPHSPSAACILTYDQYDCLINQNQYACDYRGCGKR